MKLVTLQTVRLVLRNYRAEDWERVHLYRSDPEVSQYVFWGPHTVDDTKKLVSLRAEQASVVKRSNFDLVCCLKDNDLLIGNCGIRRETQDSAVANLGWTIHPEFQRQGYATEAAQALISFGFDQLRLSVIYATCDTRNAASYRVMEKLGMKRVGFIKGEKEIKGHVRDSYRYELIRKV